MPFLSIFSLFIALADFFLANFLFYRRPGPGYLRLAAGRALLLSIFCLFSAFFYSSTSYENAVLWNQVRAMAIFFLPVVTLHFTWHWTLNKASRFSHIVTVLLYLTAFIFVIANFFIPLLGQPVQDPVYAWITVSTQASFWPFLMLAWASTLVSLSIILALLFYLGIRNPVERKRQILVFLGLILPPIPVIVIGLLPVAGLPGLLVHLPLWIFISDILIAIGLTSRNFFSVDFSSTYYPVIQSMKDAAALLDLDFTVRAVNSACCRLVEKEETALVGQPIFELFSEEQIPARQINNAIIQQGASNFKSEINLGAGKNISAELNAIPVFDRLGRLAAIAILITDTSPIKAAEVKLKAIQAEIEQKNNLLVDNLVKTNKMLEADLQQSKQEELQWRRRVFENEALANLSSVLRTARTIQEMLATLLAETTHIFEANIGAILLRYGNTLVIKSLIGLPEEFKGFRHDIGGDILSKVFQSGNPSYIMDIASLPAGDLSPFLQKAISAAVYPLKTTEKQLGLLVLGFNYKKYFNDFDQRLLSAVGNIASNALYRSNMIDSLEQRVMSRNRELETLYRITSIANEAREPKTVLEQAQKILLETLDSKLSVIFIHGKIDEVFMAAQNEEFLSAVQTDLQEISLENSIWGIIFRTNQPWLVDSLDDDRRIDIKIVTELLPLGNCALIGTPIRGSNETLGSICIFRDANQPYVQEDLSLLGTAAHQLGVAIEIIALRRQERLSTSRIERQRLGGELYDSISQLLSSSFLYAEASSKLQNGDTNNLQANLQQIRLSSLQALKEIRVLIHQLRPASIENLGLSGAIQHRLDTVERRAHIEASLSGDYAFRLPGNMEETLYQILEDALNYSARYSQATHVSLRLDSDYDTVTLEFSDDGNGQAPADAAKKSILSNIKERVENLGGKFELEMQPGHGTSMRIRL